jgi:signal transduction histidine kinase
VSRAWLFLTRYGLDLLIVVAAIAAALGTALRDDPGHPTGLLLWFEVLAVGGVILGLVWRRRFPFAAPAAMWLVCAALSFVDGRLITDNDAVFVAGMGAALLLGNLRQVRQARLGLALVVGSAAIVVYNGPNRVSGGLIFTPVLFALAWLVGYALRERAEQSEAAEERAIRAERERETAARVAVAEERGRIARELHDVVAHAVSVMVLQVGAVRHRMPETDTEDRDALRNVEQAGRTALAEMRRLLNAMRSEGDGLELLPHPGLDDLDALVADVRATGLAVEVRRHGEPVPLPPGLDLSAYRIVQEALTNVLKHAAEARARVVLEYADDALAVTVTDDGIPGPLNGNGHGGGHGLIGIRERVAVVGGEVDAGPRPEGGYEIRARLPFALEVS